MVFRDFEGAAVGPDYAVGVHVAVAACVVVVVGVHVAVAAYAVVVVAGSYVVEGYCYAAWQPHLALLPAAAGVAPADEQLNSARMRAPCYVVVIHD